MAYKYIAVYEGCDILSLEHEDELVSAIEEMRHEVRRDSLVLSPDSYSIFFSDRMIDKKDTANPIETSRGKWRIELLPADTQPLLF